MTDPRQHPEEGIRITGRPTAPVGLCIYFHLLSVAACLCLTLADRGLLLNSTFSWAFFNAMQLIILPLAMTFWICPIVVLVVIASGRVRGWSAVFSLSAEVLLCMAQLKVLLPLVM